jgi:hypothetical protein
LTIVLAAATLLLWPPGSALVERYYAGWFYPALQAELTRWSNTTRLSLFDVLVLIAGLSLLVAWMRCLRAARRERSLRRVAGGLWRTVVFAGCLYIWFALAWGLNYSRTPIESAIGYDSARVSTASLRRLAERATSEVNRTYAAAHQTGFPEVGDVPPTLVGALHGLEHRLGRPRPTVPGRPKRTLLSHFFRASGVDGMHAPFLLETLLNPDLTPPERPAVLAHEWAHLSGFADEADASFIGVLAALRADPAAQYSAWLTIFNHAASQLPSAEASALMKRLDPGVQADLRASYARAEAQIDVVADASWITYNQYLKSQGVEEGVASYSRVVQLLLGSGALDWP